MVSIIIVHYKVEKELVACIFSILKSKPKVKFEIIVVDNGSNGNLSERLKKITQVKYVRSKRNIGFGAGNNLGAKFASGEYLFFLNPDTIVERNAVDFLYSFIKNNSSAGMVAPLLFDTSNAIYPSQGSNAFNLTSAIIVSSFVNKFFPNNFFSRKFFHKNWNKKNIEEFDVVPGTAFMISKDFFEKIGKFDEEFFLYFEEYDLAKKIKELGYKNYIVPKAKIMHVWEASTKKREDIDKIFSQSRFYFFKKHYGIFFASIIDIVSSIGKYEFILGLVLITSIFLGLFKIGDLMTFIGDQGWYYLSARDMLINGQIPLVGIASSHPWLHQGPFWTYILAVLFWLFNFNPLAPGYFTVAMGAVMVFLVYKIGSEMFSKRIGLITSFLYATSPLIILNNRMPYHTGLIPLFTLLFTYSIYKWINGRVYFFPFTIFFLAILYNFEIQTVLLWFVLAILLIYGIWRKTNWVKKIVDVKIIVWSLLGLIIPMIPMLIYDVTHGFPQTLKFWLWIAYHIAKVFGFPSIHGDKQFPSPAPFIPFTLTQLQQLVFLPNLFLAAVLLLGCFSIMTYLICVQFGNKKNSIAHVIVYLSLIISAMGYIGTGTASAAYFPLFFPFTIFMLAVGLDYFLDSKKIYALGLIVILFIAILNSYFLLQRNYLSGRGYGPTFSEKIMAAKTIIQVSDGNKYNLVGKGPGSQFASFTMGYEYLTWWLGHGPSREFQELRFQIQEDRNGVTLRKI